jgi:hypothetical protein
LRHFTQGQIANTIQLKYLRIGLRSSGNASSRTLLKQRPTAAPGAEVVAFPRKEYKETCRNENKQESATIADSLQLSYTESSKTYRNK